MAFAFRIDIQRCVGCFACAVACMDQNDIITDPGASAFRNVLQLESGSFPQALVRYASLSCMHCEDAPCVMACPTGALSQDVSRGVVLVRQDLCIGCHSCSMACPFGAPRFDACGRMVKCDLCIDRVEAGLEPACVRVCPTRALEIGESNRVSRSSQFRAAQRLVEAARGAERE